MWAGRQEHIDQLIACGREIERYVRQRWQGLWNYLGGVEGQPRKDSAPPIWWGAGLRSLLWTPQDSEEQNVIARWHLQLQWDFHTTSISRMAAYEMEDRGWWAQLDRVASEHHMHFLGTPVLRIEEAPGGRRVTWTTWAITRRDWTEVRYRIWTREIVASRWGAVTGQQTSPPTLLEAGRAD